MTAALSSIENILVSNNPAQLSDRIPKVFHGRRPVGEKSLVTPVSSAESKQEFHAGVVRRRQRPSRFESPFVLLQPYSRTRPRKSFRTLKNIFGFCWGGLIDGLQSCFTSRTGQLARMLLMGGRDLNSSEDDGAKRAGPLFLFFHYGEIVVADVFGLAFCRNAAERQLVITGCKCS